MQTKTSEMFDQWYVENSFDYEKNPIGSREYVIQKDAWLAAIQSYSPTAEYEIKYAYLMQALGAESHEHALAVIADIRTAAVLMAKAQAKRNARAQRNLGAKS